MKLATGTIVDRYEVLGELGQGGMASVYTVRHTKLGSTHVLKVLSVHGKNVAERLLLEGQVQAKLKHPNVVEVTDVIEVQGAPGLVMEYIEGPSLDAVLAKGPLPLDRVADLVPGICAGIAAAHAEGVVHRDLKPANILLSLARGRVVPKVADFGLVKQLAADPRDARTRTGTAMGTPQYMAPEQIENAKDVDERADIWALGAILYEMVTGERAFDGDTHYRIFQQVVAREYRPIREANPAVSDEMVAAIEAAMRPVEERPKSVEQIWSLWCPGDALDNAATTNPSWPEASLSDLTALTPSIIATQPPSGGSVSQDTFVDLHDASLPEVARLVSPPATAEVPTVTASSGPHLRTLIALGLGLSLLAILGAGVVVAALAWSSRSGPSPTTDETTEVTAPIAPLVPSTPVDPEPIEPAPTPVVPPPAVDTTPPPPPPRPAVPTQPSPHPNPPEPIAPTPPAPQPAPNAQGTLVVQGAGDLDVYLVGSGRRFHAGDLPVGAYTIRATKGDRTESFGNATVTAGQTTVVKCQAAMWNCRAQR